MAETRLIFRVHAVKRMSERSIDESAVRQVLTEGESIEEYPTAHPLPARLMLGWIGTRPLHVVCAVDEYSGRTFIITVYEPDEVDWEPGFRRRKVH